MAGRSLVPRLTDIVEAIECIHGALENTTLEAFETDWQRQWLVERGVEIISDASWHLTDEMKARHPEIPWQKVVGIGNVLRSFCETRQNQYRRRKSLRQQRNAKTPLIAYRYSV
jgi:uncharacterized protein with HEPN domain